VIILENNFPTRAWAQINLDAIENNVRELRRVVGEECKILASVKADAYGHGYLQIAKTFVDCGIDVLGVAFIDEALQIRKAGIKAPILILGHTPNECADMLVRRNIMPTIFSRDFAEAFSRAAVARGKIAKAHIKVDTGMHRIGFVYTGDTPSRDNVADDIARICKLPNIRIDGIFTHFARADEVDETYTKLQLSRFMDLMYWLELRKIKIPVKHAANSAAAIANPDARLDMVRAGISLYGCYPSVDVDKGDSDKTVINLIPAMEFRARITQVKWLQPGQPVSYGGTFVTTDETKVATIPVGYADGVSRLLSNRGFVIAGGEKVPIIGKICMDQCMIDATSVNNIDVGDEVILFGRDNLDLEIPVEEVASLSGTISYETLCSVGKRVPRVYMRNGEIVKTENHLRS